MGKLLRKDLQALRAKMKISMDKRNPEGKNIQVIVGMGTCGISAGAKNTFTQFIDEIDRQNLSDKVVVRQSGCMGLCEREPTVEVIVPEMETVIYGKVTAEQVKEIVQSHLVEKKIVKNLLVESK